VHDRGIVFPERRGGNERAHVEETVRLAGRVAIDDGQIRSDRLCRVEGNRQRKKQAAGRRLQRRVRGGQVPLDQGLERSLAVQQLLRHGNANLAGAVAGVQLGDALEEFCDRRNAGVDRFRHSSSSSISTRAAGGPPRP